MKEVQVVSWCDACASEIGETTDHPERAAEELTVTINGGKALTVDLCEVHQKALVEPLQLLLAEYGTQLSAAPSRPKEKRTGGHKGPTAGGPWHCLCGVDPIDDGKGFRDHIQTAHGLRNLTDVFGLRCPMDGETVKLLGPHNTRSHGLANQSQLFVEASKAGDPLKIVYKQMRALARKRKPT